MSLRIFSALTSVILLYDLWVNGACDDETPTFVFCSNVWIYFVLWRNRNLPLALAILGFRCKCAFSLKTTRRLLKLTNDNILLTIILGLWLWTIESILLLFLLLLIYFIISYLGVLLYHYLRNFLLSVFNQNWWLEVLFEIRRLVINYHHHILVLTWHSCNLKNTTFALTLLLEARKGYHLLLIHFLQLHVSDKQWVSSQIFTYPTTYWGTYYNRIYCCMS